MADGGGGGGRRGSKAGGFVDNVNDGNNKDVLPSLRSKPVLKLPVNLCKYKLKENILFVTRWNQ